VAAPNARLHPDPSPRPFAQEDRREEWPIRVLAWPAYANRELNPYNALLYEHLQRIGVVAEEWAWWRLRSKRYDLAHLHWPDLRLQEPDWRTASRRAAKLLAQLLLVRARGAKVVWTAHNHESHERHHPRLERLYWWALTRLLDGHISLSRSAQADLLDRFPVLSRRRGAVVAHGNYRGVYPGATSPASARVRLGIPPDAVVLCFTGRIRAYKNVTALVEAFRELEGGHLRLLVTGEPYPQRLLGEVERAAAGDPRVLLRPGSVPDAELPVVLAASDLLVLPYRSVVNSGSALLGLSYDRPVLAPAMGSLRDLAEQVGAQHVRTYTGPISAAVLAGALDWLATRAPGTPNLQGTSWPEVAARTRAFYESVLAP
jgi:beta-1,4-mannosyltransferase